MSGHPPATECKTVGPSGTFVCTALTGHDGPHIAWAGARAVETWPNVGPSDHLTTGEHLVVALASVDILTRERDLLRAVAHAAVALRSAQLLVAARDADMVRALRDAGVPA